MASDDVRVDGMVFLLLLSHHKLNLKKKVYRCFYVSFAITKNINSATTITNTAPSNMGMMYFEYHLK